MWQRITYVRVGYLDTVQWSHQKRIQEANELWTLKNCKVVHYHCVAGSTSNRLKKLQDTPLEQERVSTTVQVVFD
jgi:hypothetical protein